MLLEAHKFNGGKVNSTALVEAPNFVFAAQRLAPKLTEAMVAPASALAVSIAESKLAPGKVTTAYLVSQNGR